jgi:hypothetical protein
VPQEKGAAGNAARESFYVTSDNQSSYRCSHLQARPDEAHREADEAHHEPVVPLAVHPVVSSLPISILYAIMYVYGLIPNRMHSDDRDSQTFIQTIQQGFKCLNRYSNIQNPYLQRGPYEAHRESDEAHHEPVVPLAVHPVVPQPVLVDLGVQREVGDTRIGLGSTGGKAFVKRARDLLYIICVCVCIYMI